jgi:hypothetical protein
VKKTWSQAQGHAVKAAAMKRKYNRRIPDLATILSRSIEEYAGIDLLDNSPQSLLFGHLLDTNERLRTHLNGLRPEKRQPVKCNKCEKKPEAAKVVVDLAPRIQILHRVFCSHGRYNHDFHIFEDVPTMKEDSKSPQDGHLVGEKGIRNIEKYCQDHSNISIIIFKEYQCDVSKEFSNMFLRYKEQQETDSNTSISPRRERMRILSDVLQKALNHVATCAPQVTMTSRQVLELRAPYLFLYHHRAALSEYASTVDGSAKDHVSLLLAFINQEYSAEYDEADRQFAAGVVTKEHIGKLYRPNDIVLSKLGTEERAYVVAKWPEINVTFELSCWAWEYDGTDLKRQTEILMIPTPADEGSPLESIGVYPMSMASHTSIEHLKERGKKFWAMKEQHFSCYSGYDFHQNQSYVDVQKPK